MKHLTPAPPKQITMALWTRKHAPRGVDDVLQPDARRLLERVREERLNALLHGPAGAGKTAAVRALARESGNESNLSVINASDFFGLTKKELRDDPRFEGFVSKKRARESSKADLINHVLKETASHPVVGEGHRILLVDNAEEMRRDFQQALRRVMEQYSGSTQFILTTRSLSSIIPAIRSRCFPVPFPRPEKSAVVRRLDEIAAKEGLEAREGALEYVAEAADGDLRKAVLLLQAASMEEVTMDRVYEVVEEAEGDAVPELLEFAREGSFDDARDVLDSLLIDQGYSGEEVLIRIVEESGGLEDREAARLVARVGEVEMSLVEGANDRIHVERLLSGLNG